MFGAYSIGKERVFMAAAAELKMKVFVDKTRWKTMLCYDWTMEQQTQLTTDPFSTSLWVVPLHNINFNSLVGLLKKKSSCNRVVAFQPTGWTHNNSPGSDQGHKNRYGSTNNTKEFSPSDIVGARRKEGHVIYSVPYSEHSSFTELVDFIQTFK